MIAFGANTAVANARGIDADRDQVGDNRLAEIDMPVVENHSIPSLRECITKTVGNIGAGLETLNLDMRSDVNIAASRHILERRTGEIGMCDFKGLVGKVGFDEVRCRLRSNAGDGTAPTCVGYGEIVARGHDDHRGAVCEIQKPGNADATNDKSICTLSGKIISGLNGPNRIDKRHVNIFGSPRFVSPIVLGGVCRHASTTANGSAVDGNKISFMNLIRNNKGRIGRTESLEHATAVLEYTYRIVANMRPQIQRRVRLGGSPSPSPRESNSNAA